MMCPSCESQNLRLDETTHHYVCDNCNEITHYTDGLVYDEAPQGAVTEGLRHFGSVAPTQSTNADMLSQIASKELKYESRADEDAEVAGPESGVESRAMRKWRMCEIYDLLSRQQVRVFVEDYLTPAPRIFPKVVDRIFDGAHTQWSSYMAITGETGKYMWATIFRRTVSAIRKSLDSRKAYIEQCTPAGRSCRSRMLPLVGRGEDNSPAQEHRTIVRMLKHLVDPGIVWVGMGPLYDPNEPKSANDQLFQLFSDESIASDNQDEDDEFDLDDVIKPEEGEENEEFQRPKKRKHRISPEDRLDFDDSDLDGSGNETSDNLPLYTQVTDLLELAELWDPLVVAKGINLRKKKGKDFMRHMFWRGRVGQYPENRLLEFNLAVLYLTIFWSLSATATMRIRDSEPVECVIYQHEYFSLHDLANICRNKGRFPYLRVDDMLIKHFQWNDPNIQATFVRERIPDPNLLAKVTSQLIHMVGFSHRPRLPLCSMVHRYARDLALPPEAHRIADMWIADLGRRVREETKDIEVGMHFYLPLRRYLRAEVFAMAIAVITSRYLFKLNDDFERCWSNVATFLSKNPKYAESLDKVLTRRQNDCELSVDEVEKRKEPFNFVEWAGSLPKFVNCGLKQRKRVRNEVDAPLNSALLFSDLIRTAKTTEEFLGPHANFNPLTDAGWGEKKTKVRKVALRETKLRLSAPLRELCSKISDVSIATGEEVTRVINAEPFLSTPCSSCNHAFEHKIFQGIDHLHENACNLNQRQWTEFSCDALIGAKKLIKERGLTVEEFLTMVIPERLAELKEIIDDWSFIITNYEYYDPIHGYRFPSDNDKRRLNTFDIPAPVLDFLEFHEKRLQDLLSGKGVNPKSGIDVYNVPVAEKKRAKVPEASASLNWLVEIASIMCGAEVSQLLKEIRCVERILKLGPKVVNRGRERLEDIALAYHFIYDIPSRN
ncbi:hypothetical protein Aperf_G00000032382 [Anoplocephala perfoliata]